MPAPRPASLYIRPQTFNEQQGDPASQPASQPVTQSVSQSVPRPASSHPDHHLPATTLPSTLPTMMFKLLVGACCLLVGVSGQRFRQLDLSSLGPTTTPVPILVDSRRIDLQTGAFVYEYAGGDGSSKFEFRYPNGTVVGNYTFVDELGVLQTRMYSAGVHDPSHIDETTDPNYVDLGNYEHYRHLERPYVHQDESFTSFSTPQQQLLSLQQPRQPVRQQQPARPIPPPVQRPFVQPQHIPRPQIQAAPQRQTIQVPQLPSVSVPLDFNTHSAARAHFSQPPIIAPTFAPPAHHAPAPAPIPRHRPVPAPNFAPAPRPAPRAPTFAPVPVHRPAPPPAHAFAPAPAQSNFQAPGHFPSNLGQSVVRQQHQPLPVAPHRLSAPQNQQSQHAAAPSPGQSTSDFLDSVINKFQG
ncbi:hypothetical protein Pcinc_035877 [Petrolisthes cinctipes]|uniref:Uncharacterized protein n=1 Tax=Petrolisthes cinctipes TaxID=88211 RepID=A0AAE1BWT5_PETCI|nr:hypothetical protein Pcinc_035877 [Petrolisthes cinctipes]